jgi:hypothetical protein
MNNRALRLALEGETIEVIEGMFVAVPVGAAEDVRALSTESFGDAVKSAGKAAWEMLAKLIAGAIAAVKGFIKWFRHGGGRNRTLSDEVRREYGLALKAVTELRRTTSEEKIESVWNADNHGTTRTQFDQDEYDLVSGSDNFKALLELEKVAESATARTLLRDGVRMLKDDFKYALNEGQKPTHKPDSEVQKLLDKIATLRTAGTQHAAKIDAKELEVPIKIDEIVASLRTSNELLHSNLRTGVLNKYEDDILPELEKSLEQFQTELFGQRTEAATEAAKQSAQAFNVYWRAVKQIISGLNKLFDLEWTAINALNKIISTRIRALEMTVQTYPGLKDELGAQLEELKKIKLKG